MQLAMTENAMLLEGKAMPVEDSDDHLVHIAVHQEALGQGMDDIVGPHIEQHQIRLGQSMGQPGDLLGDTPETPPPAGTLPTQMGGAGPDGGAPPPAPQGPPPGTQLPQQNIPQTLSQNQVNAGQALGGIS